MVAVRATFGAPVPFTPISFAYTSQALGTLGYSVGRIMRVVPPDGSFSDTITHVGYRVTSTAGTPATNSYKIGIQGVNTSGLQDGTYLASATFTPAAGVSSGWVWVALDTPLSVSRSDAIGLFLERIAATDAANAITVATSHTFLGGRPGFPYATVNAGGGNAPVTTGAGVMACKSATQIYGAPATSHEVSTSYGATTEAGFTFTLPASLYASAKVAGVRFLNFSGSTGSATRVATLYATPTGTPSILAQTALVDVDLFAQNASTVREAIAYFSLTGAGGNLATLPTLTGGTKYGIGFGYSVANQGRIYGLSVADASDLAAYSSDAMILATRTLASYPPDTDTASFVENSTSIVYAELILVDIVPAGSGGGGISAYGFAQ